MIPRTERTQIETVALLVGAGVGIALAFIVQEFPVQFTLFGLLPEPWIIEQNQWIALCFIIGIIAYVVAQKIMEYNINLPEEQNLASCEEKWEEYLKNPYFLQHPENTSDTWVDVSFFSFEPKHAMFFAYYFRRNESPYMPLGRYFYLVKVNPYKGEPAAIKWREKKERFADFETYLYDYVRKIAVDDSPKGKDIFDILDEADDDVKADMMKNLSFKREEELE